MGQNKSGDTAVKAGATAATGAVGGDDGVKSRRALAWVLTGLTALVLLPGCVVVKPYQREQLAERSMAPGFGDSAELKFRSHWEGSRQGGEGGFGTAGGGCGCN